MSNHIDQAVKLALAEDIGSGDLSANLLKDKNVTARIIARESAIVCGISYAQNVFFTINNDIKLDWQVDDGMNVSKDQVLCYLMGSFRAIVSAERVALNFLQTLSAVATQTGYLVSKIKHTKAKLLDTRKTIPGMRVAQKYAVTCGGGTNNRFGLYDCIILKENHIMAAGSISKAVKLATVHYPETSLIVEVENIDELQEVLVISGVSRVLCDNFSVDNLLKAVKLSQGKLVLEASGNIDKNNIVAVANTGVDFISVGSITKNIQAIDLSLRFS